MQIGIDPLLLQVETANGMSPSQIAALGWRIAEDNRWADIAFTHVDGPASVIHGQVMAPISLGPGVLWCGGHLMLTPLRMLPAILLEQIVGRPLRDVVDHPLIDASITVTGADGDPTRFGVDEGVPGLTVLTTDASAIMVDIPSTTRLTHGWSRFRNGAWSSSLLLLPLYVGGVSGPMTIVSIPVALLAGMRLHDAYILWIYMAALMVLPLWIVAALEEDRSRGVQPKRREMPRERFREARTAHGL